MAEILADHALELRPADVDAIRADMENKALGSRYIDMSKLAERAHTKIAGGASLDLLDDSGVFC
ncbi:MAG: hypothetical protein KAY37_12825 [Phycisphaerae bacterium]|nr:hypothetical protein [Phycisphaerae bacterium]